MTAPHPDRPKKEETKILRYNSEERILSFEAVEITACLPDGKKLVRKFRKPTIYIGSSVESDLVIERDSFVSRLHCRLTLRNNSIVIEDMGSTNGIFYKNERLQKISIASGSKFIIGKTEIYAKIIEDEEKVTSEISCMGEMIGTSGSMKEIFSLVSLVAPTDATVCITGESGTGKELIASSLHGQSLRNKGPFVAINCGAIPHNIIESELFGHEKGAFTGASQTHRGVFEQADQGTLFLDEIGEMPFDLQTRLLRVLETKSVRRIGAQRDIPINVRIIAATNQDLKTRVGEQKFREDLFFRLYIIPVHVPPLRERREDISVLAAHFIKFFSPPDEEIEISLGAMNRLLEHSWPGNVRELKNVIQRAVIINRGGSITSANIKLTELKRPGDSLSGPLVCHEKEAILGALRQSCGNQVKASRILGVARTTLANKIKKYDIDLGLIRAG